MSLHCPFCHAKEADRVFATTEDGNQVVLLMFDCPFFIRMDPSTLESEEVAQDYLDQWRIKEGDIWLEGLGPVLRQREQTNIARYSAAKPAS